MNLVTASYEHWEWSTGAPVVLACRESKTPVYKALDTGYGYPPDVLYQMTLIRPKKMDGPIDMVTGEYHRILDAVGVRTIRLALGNIAADSGRDTLSLLCGCDTNRVLCARKLFADWWRARTGEVVPEPPEVRHGDFMDRQRSLF